MKRIINLSVLLVAMVAILLITTFIRPGYAGQCGITEYNRYEGAAWGKCSNGSSFRCDWDGRAGEWGCGFAMVSDPDLSTAIMLSCKCLKRSFF